MESMTPVYVIGGSAAVAITTLLYLTGAPKVKNVLDTSLVQSIESTEFEADGHTGVPRRAASYADALFSHKGDFVTLSDLFQLSVERHANRNAVGKRKILSTKSEDRMIDGVAKKWMVMTLDQYEYLTYEQLGELVKKFGIGLRKLGLEKGDKLGLYEDTRLEWMAAAQACFAHGIVAVTVYTNLGDEALLHALNEGALTCIVSNGANVKKLLALLGSEGEHCPSLRTIIYTDQLPDGVSSSYYRLISFQEVVDHSSPHMSDNTPVPSAPSQHDLAVIMYTSGSTAMPKGVMLSHHNLVSAVTGIQVVAKLTQDDKYVAYLPLAHVLELAAEIANLYVGATIGYASVRTLVDAPGTVEPCGDLSALHPTVMAGVPTVFDRIMKKVLAKIHNSNFIVRWLFETLFAKQAEAIQEGRSVRLWDLIFGSKFKSVLGGSVRRVLSGGAPLSKKTDQFLRVLFGCPINQGYGLTETCGCGAIMDECDQGFTHVGPPVPCNEVRLVDVPEMHYLSSDRQGAHGEPVLGRGEVWIRGGNVALGYFNLPEKTAEEFTNPGQPDGWFKTGDIGQWRENGTLQIIDRKKNIVKTSLGEYVAYEKLESVIRNSRYVDNVCVYVDSLRDFAVALINPNPDALLELTGCSSLEEACASETAELAILRSIKEVCQAQKFKNFEIVKNIRLVGEEWTDENGYLSASRKIKRIPIFKQWQSLYEEMYAQGVRKL